MADKVEFASPEWVTVARQAVLEFSEGFNFGEIDTSFCEEFTDPPTHLSPDGSSVGWHLVVRDGTVTVRDGVLEDAEVRITIPYEKVLPFARLTNAEADGPAREEHRRNNVSRMGDIEAFRALGLPWAGKLHDILAAVTA